MLHNLIEIAGQLKNYENDRMLRELVVPMKSKYHKYWNDIPLLYSIAFIMDLRGKIKGFSNALRLLSSLTSTDYSAYFTSVRAALSDMFAKYESKFGPVRLARPTHKPSTGKKKAQCVRSLVMVLLLLFLDLVLAVLVLVALLVLLLVE